MDKTWDSPGWNGMYPAMQSPDGRGLQSSKNIPHDFIYHSQTVVSSDITWKTESGCHLRKKMPQTVTVVNQKVG
ncbi:hypothetical protein Q8A67_014440 [Cirrhinus molitorella]|uniref:Uncharacterized protein n=1 Tax=Cirrhinus molitorella TaxID=172907 RepID=A0AA88PGL1_9TELE|nr:hypothetical protein Q8A67_014440 [Cirrhinus molitorella]